MTIANDLRRAGWKPEQIAAAMVDGKPLAEAEPKKRSDGWPSYRSKWESLYAAELDWMKSNGEILDWMYEPIRFKLTEQCVVDGKKVRAVTYRPDFVCWLPNGAMRCIEIKGYRRTKDINRFKLAKDKFRHIAWEMWALERGHWTRVPY